MKLTCQKYSFSFFLLLTLFSCSQGNKTENKNSKNIVKDSISVRHASNESPEIKDSIYVQLKDSVRVQPFVIDVDLSPKAKQRITQANETIIVAVFCEGIPKESVHAKLQEDGSFYVASQKKEIRFGETATFDHLLFPRSIYEQLAIKNIDVTVNVFTGRKSSPDNLLYCDGWFGKANEIVNKKILLKGKLIYGDD
ncbi:MAG: hypothetical protein JST86_05720 [Bacteroidetes bacterium]|nr:hypothetical protein [Bacteroidota bacterium]